MDLDFSNKPTPPPAGGNPAVSPPVAPAPLTPEPSLVETPTVPVVEPVPESVAPPPTALPPSEPAPALPESPLPTVSSEPSPVVQPAQQPAPLPIVEEPPVKSSKAKWIIIAVAIVAIIGIAAYVFGTESGRKLIGKNDDITSVDSTSSEDNVGLDSTFSGLPATTDLGEGEASSSDTAIVRDVQRKADLATIQTYLESYKADKGAYPVASNTVKISDSSSVVVTSLVSTYASDLPDDPKASEGYYYGYKSSDGKTYELTSRLEDTTDPAGMLEGTYFIYRLKGDSGASLDSSSTSS